MSIGLTERRSDTRASDNVRIEMVYSVPSTNRNLVKIAQMGRITRTHQPLPFNSWDIPNVCEATFFRS